MDRGAVIVNERRTRAAAWVPPAWAAGVAVALAAGLWQGVMMSTPTNDDFLHLALAQLILAGDWPVRDFFDSGLTLQAALSAVSQMLVGHRLLSEALVVGTAWAVSTFVVFALVRRMSGSMRVAGAAGLLLIVSGPRGYSYPKVIVYAVAAALWWAYVRRPTAGRSVALGAWTAAAFYWRPDHGVYVAAGVILATLAAHGVGRLAASRCALAGGVAIALTAPFFVLVQQTIGLAAYVETGFAQAGFQHEGGHEWPRWPLRGPGDVLGLDTAADHAPRITLRWSAGSDPAVRETTLERYGLTPEGSEGPLLQRVRLSAQSVGAIRALINEPVVEDTAGVDRSTATLPWSEWPQWERWRFEHAWLRVRLLPGLDEHTRASEAAAALFYLAPVLALIVVVPLRRFLAAEVSASALAAFCLFAMIVTMGLLRTPYDVRAVDGIVMPAILVPLCAAVLWRAAMSVRVKGDGEVRLKPDTTGEGRESVRLKPDTTGGGQESVRLKPDTTREGREFVGLKSDATADRRESVSPLVVSGFSRTGRLTPMSRVRCGLLIGAAVVLLLVTFKSVAVAGEFGDRTSALAGEWRSLAHVRGAWREIAARLTASPPLEFHRGRDMGVPLQLAAYARACLPASDRLLVLWFAPEIYYYSGRLAAPRHLVFVPGWGSLPHEQRMTLDKVTRYSPPLVFAGPSLDGVAQATYPSLVAYVRQEYDVAGSIQDHDEQYLVFARRDRPVIRAFGEQQWPCYQ